MLSWNIFLMPYDRGSSRFIESSSCFNGTSVCSYLLYSLCCSTDRHFVQWIRLSRPWSIMWGEMLTVFLSFSEKEHMRQLQHHATFFTLMLSIFIHLSGECFVSTIYLFIYFPTWKQILFAKCFLQLKIKFSLEKYVRQEGFDQSFYSSSWGWQN